jgi:transcriptional regulator with XRE-family HTH domain
VTNADWVYKEFGQRLRAARRTADLTQEAVANTVGLSRTSITNIERGIQHISLHALYELAAAVKVKPADLLPDPVSMAPRDVIEHLLRGLSPNEQEWAKAVVSQATGTEPRSEAPNPMRRAKRRASAGRS